VLHDEADVVAAAGRDVHPAHEAVEGVMVRAGEGEDERGHSSGPTRWASG
jgi:hypothetical protein